jgi:hypothetical protein
MHACLPFPAACSRACPALPYQTLYNPEQLYPRAVIHCKKLIPSRLLRTRAARTPTFRFYLQKMTIKALAH